ncbi:MAG TPA: RES family NAD+ phosphorylase [Sphingomonas sp.]|nr:RES family NAD+ phosphorylase [Sphingomonas sp.]
MIFYRLCKKAHTALDGEGARLYGGRWNSPGRPMVYAAATASLAVLEVLVHLDLPPELIPDDYRLLTLDVPDDIAVETLERTPESEADCRAIGDRFLDRGDALGLRVPSAIVAQEHNILLNPRHAGMERVLLHADDPFRFDPRLLDRTR